MEKKTFKSLNTIDTESNIYYLEMVICVAI